MKRNDLVQEVKAEYARLAALQSGDSFAAGTAAQSPEAYFEQLLGDVIGAIEQGKFDGFASGADIVQAVANNRGHWL